MNIKIKDNIELEHTVRIVCSFNLKIQFIFNRKEGRKNLSPDKG